MVTPVQAEETDEQRRTREDAEWTERHSEGAQRHADKRDEWHKRWSLSLAIANAGGLVLLTSGLLTSWDKGHPPHWFFLPGLWSFAFGMLAAGSVQATMITFFDRHRRAQEAYAHSWREGERRLLWVKEHEPPEDAYDIASEHRTRASFGERWSKRLLWASAALFVAGVVIPLVLLTRHILAEPTVGRILAPATQQRASISSPQPAPHPPSPPTPSGVKATDRR